MAGVDWVAVPNATECQHGDGRILRATHTGVWNFMGAALRVYRLEDGRTVIDADDAERFFALLMADAPHA